MVDKRIELWRLGVKVAGPNLSTASRLPHMEALSIGLGSLLESDIHGYFINIESKRGGGKSLVGM